MFDRAKFGAPKVAAASKSRAARAAAGQPKTNRKKRSRKAADARLKRSSHSGPPAGKQAKGRGTTGALSAMNPVSRAVPPHLVPMLGVFPMNSTLRLEPITAAAKNYFVIATAIPGCGTVGVMAQYDPPPATTTLANIQFFTMPLLVKPATDGGATASRVTKVGIRVINATAPLYASGRVYVSNLAQRLTLPAAPSAMNSTQWDTTFQAIRGLPAAQTLSTSWSDFMPGGRLREKSFFAQVVDDPKYNDFSVHTGPITGIDAFFEHIARWGTSELDPRPMSTIIFSWTTPATGTFVQDLTFHFDAQHITRWPIDTVPGQNAKDIKASDPKAVARSREVLIA